MPDGAVKAATDSLDAIGHHDYRAACRLLTPAALKSTGGMSGCARALKTWPQLKAYRLDGVGRQGKTWLVRIAADFVQVKAEILFGVRQTKDGWRVAGVGIAQVPAAPPSAGQAA